MIPIASFDQLYVISDLHMGGEVGHQIFGQQELLSSFIDHLRDGGNGDTALVMNGDMVDFLAQPGAVYFDYGGANRQLDLIIKNFNKVWQSLRAFVRKPHRHLVIVLGNHDLELALPWVREHLIRQIADDDANARQRITLCFDGAGFACAVGSRQVLCVHGNEVDNWNVTDYEKLRRTSMDLIQGRPVEPWTPNAGSKLVIDIMNAIKHRHAFIDLLKPEKEGALRILLAMRPDLQVKAEDVVGIAKRWVWNTARRAFNLLSNEETPPRSEARASLDRIMTRGTNDINTDQLMDAVELDFREGVDPVDLVYRNGAGQLGMGSALGSVFRGHPGDRVAWEAVKELTGDETFRIDRRDADLDLIDGLTGANFHVVVAGHTHLARTSPRGTGGKYFNTGTWAWLMKLTDDQLKSPEAFKPVYEQLRRAETIEELENLKFARPTVAIVAGNSEPALKQVVLQNGSIDFIEPR